MPRTVATHTQVHRLSERNEPLFFQEPLGLSFKAEGIMDIIVRTG